MQVAMWSAEVRKTQKPMILAAIMDLYGASCVKLIGSPGDDAMVRNDTFTLPTAVLKLSKLEWSVGLYAYVFAVYPSLLTPEQQHLARTLQQGGASKKALNAAAAPRGGKGSAPASSSSAATGAEAASASSSGAAAGAEEARAPEARDAGARSGGPERSGRASWQEATHHQPRSYGPEWWTEWQSGSSGSGWRDEQWRSSNR